MHHAKKKILGFLAGAKLTGFLVMGASAITAGTFSLAQFGPENEEAWDILRVDPAHFELEEGALSLIPEDVPYYAMLWLAAQRTEGPTFVTEEDLEPFSAQVEILLTTGFNVQAEDKSYDFPAQMKDLTLTKNEGATQLSFTDEFVDYVVSTIEEAVKIEPNHVRLLEVEDETKVSKVTVEGFIANGLELDSESTRANILNGVENGDTRASAVTRIVESQIINETGLDLGPLDYLGEGRTSFWGSSPEREFNIRKAVNERFNGILIPPGGEFSYVEFLGPIEYGGWKQAYTIFQGTKLEKAPAGGVCQVSTTMYRAVLDAALSITEQRSHSLYVIYYQHFGDGLDATVFPGEQDFKFVNDTDNYILMVAQEEGYMEAVIRFYGEDDGRETELWGPYTASNQTDEVITGVGHSLGIGQMAWKYVITWGDGTVETRWLLSDYMSPAQQYRTEVEEPL